MPRCMPCLPEVAWLGSVWAHVKNNFPMPIHHSLFWVLLTNTQFLVRGAKFHLSLTYIRRWKLPYGKYTIKKPKPSFFYGLNPLKPTFHFYFPTFSAIYSCDCLFFIELHIPQTVWSDAGSCILPFLILNLL